MSDQSDQQHNDGGSGDHNGTSPSGASPQAGGMQAVINHISQDKIEAAMWISRVGTILFTISFVLPVFGYVAYFFT